MATNSPPPPPGHSSGGSDRRADDGNIADMRDAFARKEPLSEADLAAARAFIDHKIEMVESDPHLTPQQKADAIAELKAQRP